MVFRELLRKYRKENNMTQKEFAEKLNVSRTLLADVESGRIKGTFKFITTLSEFTKLPLSYWNNEETETIYKSFEGLDYIIDTMINAGLIQDDGKLGEEQSKIVLAVLEKEIALKIKRKKGNK